MVVLPSTRAEALARLEEFLPEAPAYAVRRNFVIPRHPHVSRLSAAIRHRLVTEEEVVAAVLAKHPFATVEKFLQEVLWRGYWKAWLEARPEIWRRYVEACARADRGLPRAVRERARRVAAGESGAPFMDWLARELLSTGYLHNHARMWWASFWIHHCGLPWELGARHFFEHLLDADPASNTLSWRWVAGLQTRGKAYIARAANIRKFTEPALLEEAGGIGIGEASLHGAEVPDFEDHPPARPPPEYPSESHRLDPPAALVLHDEDLALETGPAQGIRPVKILQLAPRLKAPSPRAGWLERARTDAAARCRRHFGCEVVACESPGAIARELRDVKTVVMMAPFAGPLRDALGEKPEVFPPPGIRQVLLRRRWDSALQPFAQRGFFPFWAQARKLLAVNGITGAG